MMSLGFKSAMLAVVAGVASFGAQVSAQDIARSEAFGAMPFRESPFAAPQGLYPIPAELTETMKHFRFDYDQDGRLIRLTFRMGASLVTPMWYVEPNYYPVPDTRFFYEGEVVRHQYYDASGRRMLNGEIYQSVYQVDALGNPTALEFFGLDGERVENAIGAARYEWEIAPDGAVLERRYNLDGEMVPARDIYEYDVLRLSYRPDGLLAVAQSLDAETLELSAMGASQAVQARFSYNEQGAFRLFELLNADGDRVIGPFGLAADIATYTAFGQAEGAHFENGQGELMALPWGPFFRVGEYDSHGNRIHDRFFDETMEPVNASFGVHEIRMRFDASGLNPVATELYDVDGELAMFEGRGFARSETRYDDAGRPTDIRFFDVDGAPALRSDFGVARIVTSYNDTARSVETRHLDLEGELTTHLVHGWAVQRITYDEGGEILSLHRE